MIPIRRLYPLAIAVLLSACAAVGVPTADTFMQKVAVAQLTVTGVRQSALTLLNSNVITVADAKNSRAAADAGNEAIDLALAVYSTACPTRAPTCTSPVADAKLAAAAAVLTATQTYLNSRSKP